MTATLTRLPEAFAAAVRQRVRPRMLPILQTATAAVIAWYVAVLLLPSDTPTFATIAAVICLGASYAQRPRRAVELMGGVLLGIVMADVFLLVVGTGPLQLGLLVILAMTVALLLRGGELAVNEAAISAILLVSLAPAGGGFSTDRILEGLIGGGVALAVASVLLPPHPVAMVDGVAQRLLGKLGRTLEETARALAEGDPKRAERALAVARGIDDDVDALEDMLETAHETARFAPPRRADRPQLLRYDRTLPQIDFAVRNTRVLARQSVRYARGRQPAPEGLTDAVRELADAVWALGAQFENPERTNDLRRLAVGASTRATDISEHDREVAVTELVGHVRSLAVDLVRAADLLPDAQPGRPAGDRFVDQPTEELLLPALA